MGANSAPSQAVESSDESVDVCKSAESVASELVIITRALSSPGVDLLRPETTGEFNWFSIGAPSSLVPGARQSYRTYASYTPRKLLAFKRRVGVIPVRMDAIAIARVRGRSDVGPYSDFAYTGRVLGRAKWRRSLQMSGKGAINCDGTLRVWSMVIRGGSTPVPRIAAQCQSKRVIATKGGAKVCRQ